MRWALIGFAVCAALPVAYGAYGILHDWAYCWAVSAPGTGTCGMGVMLSLVMILAVGPLCGMIGAALGWVAATLSIH